MKLNHPGENTVLGTVSQVVEGVTTINCYFYGNTGEAAKHDFEASFPKSHAPSISCDESYYFNMPPERLVLISK